MIYLVMCTLSLISLSEYDLFSYEKTMRRSCAICFQAGFLVLLDQQSTFRLLLWQKNKFWGLDKSASLHPAYCGVS